MNTQEFEHIAHRRAGAKLGFYIHATVFVVVMSGLFIVNYLTHSHPWSLHPFLGWGFGLTMHGLAVLGPLHALKLRLAQAELRNLEKTHGRAD